jgi:hypothetical protein
MLNRLRNWIRKQFTRTVSVSERAESNIASKARTRSRRRRSAQVPPSERFVWAMVVLIIALVGLVAIEIALILVTGAVNTEILVVLSGVVGALASRFLEAKR